MEIELRKILLDIVDDASDEGCENCYVVSASLIHKARKILNEESDLDD